MTPQQCHVATSFCVAVAVGVLVGTYVRAFWMVTVPAIAVCVNCDANPRPPSPEKCGPNAVAVLADAAASHQTGGAEVPEVPTPMPPDIRLWTSWRTLYEYCKHPTPCVKAATTHARRSVFVGLSRYGARSPARVGDRIVFGIQARDSDGVNRACGGDSFRIEIRGPSVHVGHPVDNFDGTYSFAARLFDEGVYRVHARLDYRACEGLSWCEQDQQFILIEWIGGDREDAPEIVVSGRRDTAALALLPPPDTLPTRGGQCPADSDVLYYRRWMPCDDPALRVGRWRPRDDACADPSFPGAWRCKVAAHRPAEAYVWHPIARDRPTMDDLVPRLRNVWLHSIGDSLNRFLYHHMANYAATLPEFGTPEISCYRTRMPGLARATDAFVVDSPPLECVGHVLSKLAPAYVVVLKVTRFPRVNVTFSYQHISARTDSIEHIPQRDGFKMWTNATFLRQLQGPRWWPTSAGVNSTLNETLPSPQFNAMRAFPYPFVQDESVVPTHVLFNVGIHYVSTVNELDSFPALVRKVVDSLQAEFPANRTRLIWRSSPQTQYESRTLPGDYKCRTFSRLMLVNEISAEMVADAGIPVVDYLQYSLGRGDASPDHRHYSAGVMYEVASDLLNLMFACPSPAEGEGGAASY